MRAPRPADVLRSGTCLAAILALVSLVPESAAQSTEAVTTPEPVPAAAVATTEAAAVQPEVGTGRAVNTLVTGGRWMIAAAHPLATEAGAAVLAEGGHAVDAMVATQMVLNLVEPQSSGIGGGAFLVYYDAEGDRLTTFDGRETAPMAATPQLFLDESGEPLGFWDAVVGGRSVGTPGTLALMHHVHERYGTRPWPDLLDPAIVLADAGFTVTPRLAQSVAGSGGARVLSGPSEAAKAYFFPEGTPLQAGATLTNPEFAETLRLIAEQGPGVFYDGPIGEDIVATVQGVSDAPGLLSVRDLRGYQVVERPPVCQPYRSLEVCGMGPPSSGGLTVGQILGLLGHVNLAELGPEHPQSWHWIAEASKLAFADRNQYMADSDFVPVPVGGLLDGAYLTTRAQAMPRTTAAAVPVAPGNPPRDPRPRQAPDLQAEQPGTSHVSIVDAAGNAVSLTTTIESGFGSTLMVRGFLLNNELTDFSFRPEVDGLPIANRVQPGKRPRSSMAPTVALDRETGAVRVVAGSPGGSRIIGYVAKTLVALEDWGLDAQEAVDLIHVVNRNGGTDVEAGLPASADLAAALEARGHTVQLRDLNSGLHVITIGPDGDLAGGADPRREGLVIGR